MVGATEPDEMLNRLVGDMQVPNLDIISASPADAEVLIATDRRIAKSDVINVNRTKHVSIVARLEGKHCGITSFYAIDVSR
jgi:hypothetical protein